MKPKGHCSRPTLPALKALGNSPESLVQHRPRLSRPAQLDKTKRKQKDDAAKWREKMGYIVEMGLARCHSNSNPTCRLSEKDNKVMWVAMKAIRLLIVVRDDNLIEEKGNPQKRLSLSPLKTPLRRMAGIR